MSPSNILLGRDLEEQLPEATDVSKVRKQAMARSLPNLNVGNMAGNFAEFESNLSKGTRSLPDLKYGKMVQVPNQRESNPKWWKRSGKNVERFDFDNYSVKVDDGGGNLTRVNKSFPTLANEEGFYTPGGGLKKANGGESKKANGGDERKGGDGRDKDRRKGGDRLWRRYYW